MKLRAFAVLDTKTGAFALPFFTHHVAMAMRMIYEAVSDERSSLAKYPADYVLYAIGEFDDATGAFGNHAPENHGTAAAIHAGLSARRPNLMEAVEG